MSSPNSTQSGHSPLKDALEGRRRHCEQHGELFESTPVSSTADRHHDEERRSLSEASFKLQVPQNIEEESGTADHHHEEESGSLSDSPFKLQILQNIEEGDIGSDRCETSIRLGSVEDLEGTSTATLEIDTEQVREPNTKSASSSTPKARDAHTCARDPLRPWIESMEDYFRALPPPQSRERLRISHGPQRSHNPNSNHRLSFCNGVEVQRNSDDIRHSPPLEEWRRSSWDDFLVFTDGRQANRQKNDVSNGTAASSSTPSFRKRSDDSDDRYAARERKRRSSAERKHSEETAEVKGKSKKRDDEYRLREVSAKSIHRGERQRPPPHSPSRRRQPHHRACACNAFDALLGD